MNITDAEIIKTGEKELLDSIIGELDWGAIEKIFMEKHHLVIHDDVEYRHGDIVAHNDRVAYRLDFDVKVTLSILIDRSGNFLSVGSQEDLNGRHPEDAFHQESLPKPDAPESSETSANMDETESAAVDPNRTPAENMSAMASQLSDIISEINEE